MLEGPLKLWKKPRSPAFKLCYLSTSSERQDMSPECRTIACQRLTCMVNHPLATERGVPRKRYEDCLQKSLTACHVDPLCWSDMSADRDAWRHSIIKLVDEFQQDRRHAQKDKRSKKKLEPRQIPHRTLHSPVETAHKPAFHA